MHAAYLTSPSLSWFLCHENVFRRTQSLDLLHLGGNKKEKSQIFGQKSKVCFSLLSVAQAKMDNGSADKVGDQEHH